jgi:hypothetical protein
VSSHEQHFDSLIGYRSNERWLSLLLCSYSHKSKGFLLKTTEQVIWMITGAITHRTWSAVHQYHGHEDLLTPKSEASLRHRSSDKSKGFLAMTNRVICINLQAKSSNAYTQQGYTNPCTHKRMITSSCDSLL